MRAWLPVLGLALLAGAVGARPEQIGPRAGTGDIPVGGLRGSSYGAWTMSGDAFRSGPARGDLLVRLEIHGNRTDCVISSEVDGDQPQGTFGSPAFTIERDYLSFLIGGGDLERSTCLDLIVDGKVVRSATGHRSDVLSPQSWDVRPWRGKQARIEVVDRASGDWGHINVDRILQTDTPERPPVSPGPLYQEKLRPGFHFTARQWTMDRLEPKERQEGWINDLNGLIFYRGEWHLFAQRWAKCWLHAVSRDLLHWTELEPAFWEESEGSGVQSGTCVIDYANTSGLSKDPGQPAMVAFWSRFDNRSQCISYSLDAGRTWARYAGNPTFVKAERDPKVFWYAPPDGSQGHWVMIMYGDGAYHILTSANLLDWRDEGNPIPDSFECPDFFQLPLDGDPAKQVWVLVQGNGQYSLGSFDGRSFAESSGRFACDLGPNFYATQSWHNTETGDGRRIQAAWMRGPAFPGMPFNQQVSFPCELSLRSTPAGPRIFRNPIRELRQLEDGEPRTWASSRLEAGESLELAPDGKMFRLTAEVEIPVGSTLVLRLRGETVAVGHRELVSGEAHGRVQESVRKVEILLDRASIETFVNDGELSSTRTVLPRSEGLSLKADGGPATVRSLRLVRLRST